MNCITRGVAESTNTFKNKIIEVSNRKSYIVNPKSLGGFASQLPLGFGCSGLRQMAVSRRRAIRFMARMFSQKIQPISLLSLTHSFNVNCFA